MRTSNRKKYSQNNIAKRNLAYKLVELSSIDKDDTVVDIGAGRGRLTEPLVEKAGKVIAIELDKELCEVLVNKFKGNNNLEIINADYLKVTLQNQPYKVFANIPFMATANIIRKLTSDENLNEAYLVVQKEAAKKFIGRPYDNKNQMMSTFLKPFFEMEIAYEFKRTDFEPVPRVDTLFLHLKRRETSLINKSDKNIYEDFIVWYYNKNRASYMKFEKILSSFSEFLKSDKRKIDLVSEEARRINSAQEKIEKVNRTRKVKNWQN